MVSCSASSGSSVNISMYRLTACRAVAVAVSPLIEARSARQRKLYSASCALPAASPGGLLVQDGNHLVAAIYGELLKLCACSAHVVTDLSFDMKYSKG